MSLPRPHAHPGVRPPSRPRAPWVDTAKGISILLVVLLHTSLWLRQADMDRIPAFSALNTAFEDLRMPLFFAMSGLFAAKWLAAGWGDFLRTKASLLVWVFLLWQIPVIAYRIIGGHLLPGMVHTDLGTQLETWAWSPLRANAELWFLWALVLFFLAGRLLQRVPTGWVIGSAAALSVVWSGLVWPGATGLEGGELRHLVGTGLFQAPAYFLFFIAAARGSSRVRDGVARVPQTVWAAVAVGWLVAFAGLGLLEDQRDQPGVVFLCQVCGVVGGIALAVSLQRIRPAARALAFLGRHTLEVYLSHTTIVVALTCLLYLTGSPLLAAPWAAWTVVAVALAAIGLGMLLGRAARGTWLLEAPAALGRWPGSLRQASDSPASTATSASSHSPVSSVDTRSPTPRTTTARR
ncbi:acyltransferase family protein [Citricoccus parietis]|uniref:Acyltransferase family protein n=2 Tax=Citricoccus parietis TaxID=592307 RepID=A0ABV5FY63_9MICC